MWIVVVPQTSSVPNHSITCPFVYVQEPIGRRCKSLVPRHTSLGRGFRQPTTDGVGGCVCGSDLNGRVRGFQSGPSRPCRRDRPGLPIPSSLHPTLSLPPSVPPTSETKVQVRPRDYRVRSLPIVRTFQDVLCPCTRGTGTRRTQEGRFRSRRI